MAQPSSPLDDLRTQDEHNYKEIRKAFENEALIPDDLIRAYALYRRAAQPHLISKAGSIASALVGGICSQHLMRGALSLFRLHSSQMFRETRAAVEAAGMAYAIQRDEMKLAIFLEDDGRPEQRRKARATFKPSVIFPGTEPRLKLLNDHYDLASQRSHTNVLSFVLHLSKSDDPAITRMHIQDVPQKTITARFPIVAFLVVSSAPIYTLLCRGHLPCVAQHARIGRFH